MVKYLTSTRFGRTRSTSDKNQPSVELSLMTTSSPSRRISQLTCRDGGEMASVTTGSKLSKSRPLKSLAGITREMSRLNDFPSYCSSADVCAGQLSRSRDHDSVRGVSPYALWLRLLVEMKVYRNRPSFQLEVGYRRTGDWLD